MPGDPPPDPDAPRTLALVADPAALARLAKCPHLAALRTGSARGAALSVTWYDTADGALAAQGLALELTPARRGARQDLLRVLPDPARLWLPGTPPEVLETRRLPTARPDPLGAGLAEETALVALAAAEGRQRSLPIAWQGRAARVSLLEGRLRTVAAEAPFARLLVDAPGADAIAIAAHLAAHHPLLPAPPVAEAARALALGTAPRPPRRGAPVLDAAMTAEDGFAHAGLHLAAGFLALLPDLAGPAAPETITPGSGPVLSTPRSSNTFSALRQSAVGTARSGRAHIGRSASWA